ncbi:hypothetical protein C2857_000788 [Epichloe festucae Fl1]|uniref:Uncharacterized protein n=1 Tax=Epichloe festucae (strain Fl1) TaxID=877507 RepID=A0A7U3Q2A2_EPIFF|nr:hypothetical protein C2857_000788 [Epichloe festucae Fl1]
MSMTLLEAFGVFTGILGIFSFTQKEYLEANDRGAGFRFAVGLDGAGPRGKGLTNAGGTLPDIRVFNEHGSFLGIKVNDQTKCASGETECDVFLAGVTNQPTYTLFTANDDAICVAYVIVTFAEGTKYAWTGNWAKQCGAPWYYSDIVVRSNRGAEKILCAWLDADGNQPTTGLQVHWPSYSTTFKGNGNKANYYCTHPTVQTFHRDKEPKSIKFQRPKHNMFASNPSVETGRIEETSGKDITPRGSSLHERMAKDTRLVKSKASSHLASDLCNSPSSVGPSLVSYHERKFCHMANKKLYPICASAKSGDCWDDEKHEIVSKAAGGTVKRAANPAVAFTEILFWGQK